MKVWIDLSPRWKDLAGGYLGRRRQRAWRAGLRDAGRSLRTQATRHVRGRQALRARTVRDRISLRMLPGGVEVAASGSPIPLAEYPHRQTARGVTVRIRKGAARLIPSAFEATVGGHRGVFRRVGRARLPIKELYGPTVADVLRDTGVADRLLADAYEKFRATYERVLALEER